MARSARPQTGNGQAIRHAYAERLRRLHATFPTLGLARMLEDVETGREIELDTAALHQCLTMLGEHVAARRFKAAADPGRERRFLLDGDDTLTELARERQR
jgi:hypothetical protein